MSTAIISSNIANEGDAVIIYEDIKSSKIIKLTSTGYFDTRFGRFQHKDIIGKQYGSKIHAKSGYVYMLRPSPTLITQSLPHRTQILYNFDISVIILKLNLKPGSIVVESGTGSGSLSSSLATVVGSSGFLYTFEFNQDRAIKAQQEFDTLGFKNIKVTWRDACGDGFVPKEGDDYNLKECDAVFLDLPKPWDAIGHSSKVLKKGGRICSFSPCIEQVQKTCLELKKQNYLEVRTFECIGRNYERKKNTYKNINLNQGPNPNKRRGKELEDEKEVTKKEKLENPVNEEQATEKPQDDKVEEKKEEETPVEETTKDKEGENKSKTRSKAERKDQEAKEKLRNESFFTSGSQFTQGHTGYLTFAVRS